MSPEAKKRREKLADRYTEAWCDLDLHEKADTHDEYCEMFNVGYKFAKTEEAEKLKVALEALEFECGNRCAQGLNPCNAREAIDKIGSLK